MESKTFDERKLNQQKLTVPERVKLWIAPIFNNECSPSGKTIIDVLHKIYHSASGILEVIGYPSPRRHESYFIDRFNSYIENHPENENVKILMLGAMSPSSIADIIVMATNSRLKKPELTVIDICRTPLGSGKKTLTKVAERLGIKLNLVQANINSLPFKEESYDVIIGDQILNFIDATDWPNLLDNLLKLVKPGGKLMNVIATYKRSLPYYGKRSEGYLQNLENRYPDHQREILSTFQLSYVGITGLINNQTAFDINKPTD